MDAKIHVSRLGGTATVPPSKSAAHRAVLCAALAEGTSHITNIEYSKDIRATLGAAAQLGAKITEEAHSVTIKGHGTAGGFVTVTRPVFCNESGSTLRFMIPLFSLTAQKVRFTGAGRLFDRPQAIYQMLFERQGLQFEQTPEGITIFGRLRPGGFTLPGDVSSQFITGLLFALPLCREDSRIRLTTPLESAGYVDMTLQVLRQAGIRVEPLEDGWFIPGSQTYRPLDTAVESDWSQAAFLLAAGALGGEVTLTGLNPASAQGDREALSLFRRFGAAVEEAPGRIVCRKAPLHGIDIDAAQIPDLVPVLAVTAALADGVTHITGAARLRLKESDRLAAVADGIRRLGGRVEEGPDSLTITGVSRLAGGRAEGYNDHRIVMALSMAALGCEAPVTVTDAQSVAKSWPAFFEDYRAIGGTAHVIDHR